MPVRGQPRGALAVEVEAGVGEAEAGGDMGRKKVVA